MREALPCIVWLYGAVFMFMTKAFPLSPEMLFVITLLALIFVGAIVIAFNKIINKIFKGD